MQITVVCYYLAIIRLRVGGHVRRWVVATQRRKSDFKSCFYHVEDADDAALFITAWSWGSVMQPKSHLFFHIAPIHVYITVVVYLNLIPNLTALLRLSKANLR
jgi:hypothetical protein